MIRFWNLYFHSLHRKTSHNACKQRIRMLWFNRDFSKRTTSNDPGQNSSYRWQGGDRHWSHTSQVFRDVSHQFAGTEPRTVLGERAKLQYPEKVTLYVLESVYLATKWVLRETDFEFIMLKGCDSICDLFPFSILQLMNMMNVSFTSFFPAMKQFQLC